ncbi:PREDICTED: zinc finger CCCH domain-containing protein 30-like [Ipomoea nil]|uniref:zinc finger CCCH domain-containing protein 30-like n=1 Tax=Ipomoea nil TaxID=35883 RepID=UPI0009012006|nr:PREDICTED: zinc finger CCCH domain-containing protein 30-like [Ipomoea nil]
MNLNHLMVETEDTFASLLEFAANNDVQGIERWIERDPSGVDEVGLWYGRRNGSKLMVLEHRTPLMVAANYGSIDVLRLILSLPEVDVNRWCGRDKSTALHCAASGGSLNCVDTVKLLLAAGADPKLVDANGNRPIDVIVSQNLQDMRLSLENLLRIDAVGEVLTARSGSGSNSPPLSPSPGNQSASCSSGSVSSPKSEEKFNDPPGFSMPERKEYPVDPSLPDIKNSIYSSDEFRMFSFKIRPCSRAYSHDWTECPFLHPGENARRRDPRKYHYSCVPCPEFRNKGACRRGDMCEYAHGVFESWLHPAQYRTRLCKDGTKCNRRVCFFAHTQDELRPLYVPSPTSNAIEFAAAMGLIPGSPSPFTPPISPSKNGIPNMGWPQQNVPALHLPGGSRLRSSFHVRDIPLEELNMLPDFDVQRQQISRSSISTSSFNRSESSSPGYSDQALPKSCFSPTHKSAVLHQFQLLSPINNNTNSPPKSADNPLLQTSFGVSSPGRTMSPRVMDPVSPLPSHVSLLSHHEKQQQFRSLSFNSSAAVDSWPKWDFSGSKPTRVVDSEPFGKLRRSSSSFEQANNGEEPDLSWVQRLVKESPRETTKDKSANAIAIAGASVEGSPSNSPIEHIDQSELSAWLEQVQLGQLLAQ